MSHPNRRALLVGATGAAAFASSAIAIAVDAEDPVLPLYRKWARGRMSWYAWADVPGNGNYDHPASLAAERDVDEAFDQIINTPPTTMAGVAALMVILWDCDGPGWRKGSTEYYDELERPLLRLKANIWRGASGLAGFPPFCDLEGALDFLPGGADV